MLAGCASFVTGLQPLSVTKTRLGSSMIAYWGASLSLTATERFPNQRTATKRLICSMYWSCPRWGLSACATACKVPSNACPWVFSLPRVRRKPQIPMMTFGSMNFSHFWGSCKRHNLQSTLWCRTRFSVHCRLRR